MEDKTLEAIEKYNMAQQKVKIYKEELEAAEQTYKNARQELKKLLPSDRWVYYDEVLYGKSWTDWPMDTGDIVTLICNNSHFQNGDRVQDWTGKLGLHHVNMS
jgi:hypothetical protein